MKKPAIFITAISIGLLLIVLVYKLPQWQIEATPFPPTGKERIEAENNTRDILLKGIGGAFFFITAYFSWRNLQTAEKNYQISEDKQITERFGKAVEQLGSDQIEVRLGGIYSLERIAKDSPKDHWVIMEVLTAFVREKSLTSTIIYKKSYNEANDEEEERLPKIPIYIQAALTVIGRRNAEQDPKDQRLDLSRANLTGANLHKANLAGANLFGTELIGANLHDANLNYTNLSYANLHRVNLFKAYLIDANLNNAVLTKAVLGEATLMGAKFNDADLAEAFLGKANFHKAVFARTKLAKAFLPDADLTQAEIYAANLVGATLSDANLTKANLTETNLVETNFYKANLTRATFSGSSLSKANFTGANFYQADFSGQLPGVKNIHISGADLEGATLKEAQNLTVDQVKQAENWEKAIYDEAFQKKLGLLPEAPKEGSNEK